MVVRAEEIGAGFRARRANREDRRPPSVSVVIPTLNEAENLPHVLPRIPEWVDEIVIVDGHSNDGTVSIASGYPRVRIVLAPDRGKGVALRKGFEAAVGDIIVAMDADGSTDPAEIPAFVGVLRSGADVAMGSRFACGGGTSDMELHRRLGNWMLTRVVRLAFGAEYSDLCYGYFAFWSDVLTRMDGDFTGFEVETVMHIRAVRAGLKVAEVPSFESRRIYGVSNLRTVRDGLRVGRSILREFRQHIRLSAPARREPDNMIDLVAWPRRSRA
jgi:glycosyltransferase involved in cell wall biosynthesis